MATVFALTMKEGPTPGQRTELQRRSLLLGRDPGSDLPINDVEVSRRHARLTAQSGGYAIEDLGSTNGTFVNEQRIQSVVVLQPGDTIRLGDLISFVYEVESADEANTRGFAVQENAPSPVTPAAARPLRRPQVQAPAVPVASAVPTPAPAQPAAAVEEIPAEEPELPAGSVRRRPRRKGIRLPVFSKPWITIAAIILLLGICSAIFFFWYVDANFLWCDVFGDWIPACVVN